MAHSHSNGHQSNGHAAGGHDDHGHGGHGDSNEFEVRILRQDGPGKPSYWERHRVTREDNMNVTSVLERIAAKATTAEGQHVSPVCWQSNCLEEVCGACTMVINGKVRQGCSALVDKLLTDNPGEIELQPMSKFPVVRDLVVDRSRMFRGLERIKAWIPVDGYIDMGSGPRQSMAQQEASYPYSQCMTCGCCVEACPQYTKIELEREEGETTEQFKAREKAAQDIAFVGPAAIGQTVLFNMNPTGAANAGERLDIMTAPGGIQSCGNAQNCVAVCPKNIPLTTAIGKVGRDVTLHVISKWFGG